MLELGLKLIQAREIAKAIPIQLGPELPLPSLRKFTNPDQRVTVPGGSKRYEIFRYGITRGSEFGVIRKIANVYYSSSTAPVFEDELFWIVDGLAVEEAPIKRFLGSYPNTPTPVLVPFTDEILWLATNNDTSSHDYGVLCDGYAGSLKDKDAILSLAARGVI